MSALNLGFCGLIFFSGSFLDRSRIFKNTKLSKIFLEIIEGIIFYLKFALQTKVLRSDLRACRKIKWHDVCKEYVKPATTAKRASPLRCQPAAQRISHKEPLARAVQA